jgi:hypothetical protein
MKKSLFAALLVCAIFSPLSPASAMMAIGGEQYVLPATVTVPDDLYAAGATLIANGNINGDLVAGGGNITINGNISQDAMIAGGNISLLGNIGDDVRMVGGNAVIGKNVKGDILFAGGTLYILKDAVVSGDVALAGGSIVVDGTIKGKTRISADSITVNGSLEGEVEIFSGNQLKFGPAAIVRQSIKHQGFTEAIIEEGGRVGKIDFTKLEDPRKQTRKIDTETVGAIFAGIFGVFFLIKLVAMLVVALLAVNLVGPLTSKLVEESLKDPLVKALRGFAWLVLVPIVLLILLLTIIGAGAAMVAGSVYAVSIAIAKVLAGIILGTWILRLSSKGKAAVDWKPAVLGVITFQILCLIPIIGWLAAFWVSLLALGGVYTFFSDRLKAMK